MKQYRIALFLMALVFFSCEFDESSYRYNLGADFIDDPTRVIMIDTMTVNTYTTLSDSIVTSRGSKLLAGRFENKIGIATYCESYFRFDPYEYYELHETAVFDSACFILYPDDYSFGDTTKTLALAIHELTEQISVDEESEYIFNHTRFDYETNPLATFNYRVEEEDVIDNENDADSIVIRLSDDYGKRFFDMVVNEDTLLDDKDDFNQIFKGYVIKPANNEDAFVAAFNAVADSVYAPKIRVYYHDFTPNDDLYFDYVLENFEAYTGGDYSLGGLYANSYLSTYIENDYSSSAFGGIEPGEGKLPSSETNNLTIIQGGVGLKTRIEIPGIDELYWLGVGSVVQAVLYFEPLKGTYEEESDLPTGFEMYLVDSKNRSYGQMYNIEQSSPAVAVLDYDKEFKDKTHYSFDLTHFFRDEYMSKGDSKYSLQMTYPQARIGHRVDQLIMGSQDHPENQMYLKLYLTNY
ncbi:MAG: DUF4270 domain-containing protein [Prolixibacteraceae bacterium]|nr:DUF4270 domain-containing protein [Prolixibacteraceae bacterium]